MELRKLEDTIRADARKIVAEGHEWTAVDVSSLLQQIADQLAVIRREQKGGIDASMGKRSGLKVEI